MRDHQILRLYDLLIVQYNVQIHGSRSPVNDPLSFLLLLDPPDQLQQFLRCPQRLNHNRSVQEIILLHTANRLRHNIRRDLLHPRPWILIQAFHRHIEMCLLITHIGADA